MQRNWYRETWVVAVLAVVASVYTYWAYWLPAHTGGMVIPNHDAYRQFYPNLLYLMEAVRSKSGLLWNGLQNCGQPAFANLVHGALYPLYAVFFVFGPDRGMFVLAGLHFLIGGVGAYLLCRELRLTVAASLSGALAFELGGATLLLTTWLPTVIATYVWLPAAVWGCERVLRRPQVRWAIMLGVILALQLLPGYPQVSFFTYQIIAFRVLWELVSNPAAARLRILGMISLALVLGPCLVAVQYVPAWEFAEQSVRGGRLSLEELRPPKVLKWTDVVGAVKSRKGIGRSLSVVTSIFVLFGVAVPRARRIALCYTAILIVSVVLAFDNPVFDLYRRLPLASTFRLPHRFLWVAAFIVCPLSAFGVDAVLHGDPTKRRRRIPWFAAVVAVVGGFYFFTAPSLMGWEAGLMAAVLVLAALSCFVPSVSWVASSLIPCIVLWGLLGYGRMNLYGFLADTSSFRKHAKIFRQVEERMTLQDRIYQFGRPGDTSMSAKTATLFGVPSIIDYEPQTSQRYATLFVWLLNETAMRNINQFNLRFSLVPRNRPLLNLLATRYLIVDEKPAFHGPTEPPLKLLGEEGRLRYLENTAALPRAYYVPRASVVRKPDEVLRRLTSPSHDPREVALVEEPPPGGRISPNLRGTGEAEIMYDFSETLGIRVRAGQPGYLVLTDQYYPGWEATVNGVGTPIARANYAFRLVQVPRGKSIVVFRYRPRSLRIGLAITLLTGGLVLGYVVMTLRRRS